MTGEHPASQVRPVLSGLGLSGEIPAGRGLARDRWESLQALAQLADDFFAAAPQATLGDLAAELALRSETGQAPAMGGVTLASLHAAKGLEWDAVFLPGLADGIMPIVYAQTDQAIEEERRLLYVGVTRARERVFLSWAMARSPGGRRTRKPPRFLDDIRPRPIRDTAVRLARGSLPGGARSVGGRPGGPGPAGGGPDGRDDLLVRRLMDWRAGPPPAAGGFAVGGGVGPALRVAARTAAMTCWSGGSWTGGWRPPESRARPPLWSSPTRRCARSRGCGRPAAASLPPSPGSGPSSLTGTVPPYSRCARTRRAWRAKTVRRTNSNEQGTRRRGRPA